MTYEDHEARIEATKQDAIDQVAPIFEKLGFSRDEIEVAMDRGRDMLLELGHEVNDWMNLEAEVIAAIVANDIQDEIAEAPRSLEEQKEMFGPAFIEILNEHGFGLIFDDEFTNVVGYAAAHAADVDEFKAIINADWFDAVAYDEPLHMPSYDAGARDANLLNEEANRLREALEEDVAEDTDQELPDHVEAVLAEIRQRLVALYQDYQDVDVELSMKVAAVPEPELVEYEIEWTSAGRHLR